MGNRKAGKMPVSERAKQFMPFAALRGLEEALAEQDRTYRAYAEQASGRCVAEESELYGTSGGESVPCADAAGLPNEESA